MTARGKTHRYHSTGESGLKRDYTDVRRESSLLSHKAIGSAGQEVPFQLYAPVSANRTLIYTQAVTWLGKQIFRS